MNYSQIMLRILGAFAIVAAATPATASAQAASAPSPGIDWEVSERFRLFSRAGTEAWRRIDALMETIAADPAANLSEHHEAFLTALADRNGERLRASNYGPGETDGSGRYSPLYLYPDSYEITVRAADPALAQKRCRWWTDHGEGREEPCTTGVRLRAGPGRREGSDWTISTTLSLSIEGGPEHRYDIRFTDMLIVALGDSYISGEGNPDVPSEVTDRPLPVFRHASWGSRLEGDRNHYRRAIWWDEPCHRTLLSWPVLASLAYAAPRPRQAATLVHLGCSGASIPDILEHGEIELPGGGDEPVGDSQLAQLERLLNAVPDANRRVPNWLLLSIGGNDSGFVGVIKTIILPPEGYFIPILGPIVVGHEGEAICPYRDSGLPLSRLCSSQVSAQERLESILPGALARLVSALGRPGWGSVYHFTYPNPIVGENRRVCDVIAPRDPSHVESMSGFEAAMGILPRLVRGHRYTWDFHLDYAPELGPLVGGELFPGSGCDWQAESTDSEVCQGLWVHARLNRLIVENGRALPSERWRVVESHSAAILGHGLCYSQREFPLGLARVDRGGFWVDGWTPRSYRPYDRANERWFRTPNDSIVTQYGGPDHFYHGTFHPTFSAHLRYAEAALRAALER